MNNCKVNTSVPCAVYTNSWDTGGGPGFNGSVMIIKRRDRYVTVSTNNSISDAAVTLGSHSSLRDALADENTSANVVGPGTVEVACTELQVDVLLRLLRVYNPEEDEEATWVITVNGCRVQVTASGFRRL